MPTIFRFYGISIKMFFNEHGVPHFGMIEGDLPGRAERMVRHWAAAHQAALLDMWKTQNFVQVPGLD